MSRVRDGPNGPDGRNGVRMNDKRLWSFVPLEVQAKLLHLKKHAWTCGVLVFHDSRLYTSEDRAHSTLHRRRGGRGQDSPRRLPRATSSASSAACFASRAAHPDTTVFPQLSGTATLPPHLISLLPLAYVLLPKQLLSTKAPWLT